MVQALRDPRARVPRLLIRTGQNLGTDLSEIVIDQRRNPVARESHSSECASLGLEFERTVGYGVAFREMDPSNPPARVRGRAFLA